MMDVGALVDAALVGFDRREPITIPVLPDAGSGRPIRAPARRCCQVSAGSCRPNAIWPPEAVPGGLYACPYKS